MPEGSFVSKPEAAKPVHKRSLTPAPSLLWGQDDDFWLYVEPHHNSEPSLSL